MQVTFKWKIKDVGNMSNLLSAIHRSVADGHKNRTLLVVLMIQKAAHSSSLM